MRCKWLSPSILFDVPVEFMDIIMMRKMLLAPRSGLTSPLREFAAG
jgi:hypothetical protein